MLWVEKSDCAYLPYDLMMVRIISSYEDFLASNFNDDTKGLYECIEHYFININENILKQ
jgi:hypothetical protein